MNKIPLSDIDTSKPAYQPAPPPKALPKDPTLTIYALGGGRYRVSANGHTGKIHDIEDCCKAVVMWLKLAEGDKLTRI